MEGKEARSSLVPVPVSVPVPDVFPVSDNWEHQTHHSGIEIRRPMASRSPGSLHFVAGMADYLILHP